MKKAPIALVSLLALGTVPGLSRIAHADPMSYGSTPPFRQAPKPAPMVAPSVAKAGTAKEGKDRSACPECVLPSGSSLKPEEYKGRAQNLFDYAEQKSKDLDDEVKTLEARDGELRREYLNTSSVTDEGKERRSLIERAREAVSASIDDVRKEQRRWVYGSGLMSEYSKRSDLTALKVQNRRLELEKERDDAKARLEEKGGSKEALLEREKAAKADWMAAIRTAQAEILTRKREEFQTIKKADPRDPRVRGKTVSSVTVKQAEIDSDPRVMEAKKALTAIQRDLGQINGPLLALERTEAQLAMLDYLTIDKKYVTLDMSQVFYRRALAKAKEADDLAREKNRYSREANAIAAGENLLKKIEKDEQRALDMARYTERKYSGKDGEGLPGASGIPGTVPGSQTGAASTAAR